VILTWHQWAGTWRSKLCSPPNHWRRSADVVFGMVVVVSVGDGPLAAVIGVVWYWHGGDAFEDVVDERVQGGHGLVGDTDIECLLSG